MEKIERVDWTDTGKSADAQGNIIKKRDIATYKNLGIDGYVATPNGMLLNFSLINNDVFIIDSGIPSDSNDPDASCAVTNAPPPVVLD